MTKIKCFPGGLSFRKPERVTYCYVSGPAIDPNGKEKMISRDNAAILMRAVYRALQQCQQENMARTL